MAENGFRMDWVKGELSGEGGSLAVFNLRKPSCCAGCRARPSANLPADRQYRDGNDTANFLFVPVNDAGVTGGRAHWPLLLVDRRAPTAPVAYHDDSAGSSNSTLQNSSQLVWAPA